MHNLETKLNQPVYEKLLASDKNVHFIQTLIELNCSLSYMLRLLHWLGDVLIMSKTRRLDDLKLHEKKLGLMLNYNQWMSWLFIKVSKKFLLTLMKLRLGLLGKDIAHRFGISNTLCTQISHSWIRGKAEYFDHSFLYQISKQY